MKAALFAGLMTPKVVLPSSDAPGTVTYTNLGVDEEGACENIIEWAGVRRGLGDVAPPDSLTVAVFGQDGKLRTARVASHYFRFVESDGQVRALPEGDRVRLKARPEGVAYEKFGNTIHLTPLVMDLGFQVDISASGTWSIHHRIPAFLSAYVVAHAAHEMMSEASGVGLPPVDLYPMANAVSITQGELPFWNEMAEITADILVGDGNTPAVARFSVVGDAVGPFLKPTDGKFSPNDTTRLKAELISKHFLENKPMPEAREAASLESREFIRVWDSLEVARDRLVYVAECPDIVAHEVGHAIFQGLNGAPVQGPFGECFGDLVAALVGLGELGQGPSEWKDSPYWPAVGAGIAPDLAWEDFGIRPLSSKPSEQDIADFNTTTIHQASEVPSYFFIEVLKKRLQRSSSSSEEIAAIQREAAAWLAHTALLMPSHREHTLVDVLYAFTVADELLGSSFHAKALMEESLGGLGDHGGDLWASVQALFNSHRWTMEKYEEAKAAIETTSQVSTEQETKWSSGLVQRKETFTRSDGTQVVLGSVYQNGRLIFF